MITHLRAPDPDRQPRLLRRLSGEAGSADSLWQVLPAGRDYYPVCRVVMLSVTVRGVAIQKVL